MSELTKVMCSKLTNHRGNLRVWLEGTRLTTIGRHYNKRRSTEPFLINSGGKERLLTPVEHARVKGIPEHFIIGVCATTAHQVLGQAGLWNHAKGVGLRIAEILTDVKQSITLEAV